ncbi:hypothetical protein ACTL6P_15465 [Endozoicomonas acroporae]|uniref:hypothetical protein n=1 Tax=Endozoicomonas acroporae TaxID=1701104 RepID=UPI000C77FDF3|nr:hypothetical protein [Endozoicomonas acroporae]
MIDKTLLHKQQNACKRKARRQRLAQGDKTLTALVTAENHAFLFNYKEENALKSVTDVINEILNKFKGGSKYNKIKGEQNE